MSETSIKYCIFELDEHSGLVKKQRNFTSRERIVLTEAFKIERRHDSYEKALEEINKNGDTYIEYIIIPVITKC